MTVVSSPNPNQQCNNRMVVLKIDVVCTDIIAGFKSHHNNLKNVNGIPCQEIRCSALKRHRNRINFPNFMFAIIVLTALGYNIKDINTANAFNLITGSKATRRAFNTVSFVDNHQILQSTTTHDKICLSRFVPAVSIPCTYLRTEMKLNSQSTSSESEKIEDLSDELEWRALLASLTMYRAAYGDLKVPQRFVVPDKTPWPKPAWSLKLGKEVYAIRSTGKYISGQQQRRQQLDRLGFVWSVRRNSDNDNEENGIVTLEQLILAADTYRRLSGGSSSDSSVAEMVPENFVVPDSDPWPESVRSLPLGRQLEALKKNCPNDVREKLEDLGILAKIKPQSVEDSPLPSKVTSEAPEDYFSSSEKMSSNDIRFQNVFVALKKFKEFYGDLLVPQPFIVPNKDNSWPEETWGLRLGARVNAIRSQGTFINNSPERRQMLDDIGFVWSPPKEERGRRGRIPKAETMEQDDGSIGTSENMGVGSTGRDDDPFGNMDNLFDGSFDFGQDLNSPTDFYDKPTSTSPSWDLEGARLPDIVAKAAEQEAALREEEYQPPRTLEESLNEATQRAIEIGVIEGLTPTKRVIKGKREKDIPWFNDDFGGYFVFDDVVEALTAFKSINGDFSNLTGDFVVPTPVEITGFVDDDDDFITDTYDVAASSRAAAASIAELERKGDVDRSEDLIAAEIQRLQKQVGQGLVAARAVATRNQVEEADQWGEHLAGMQLGSIVTRIRDGSLEVKHIPERKAQLDAIGFEWGDPKYFLDVPFEKAMCAMYAYYLVRGDMFVYVDFVMPDEDPWPQSLAGYELGEAVKRLRELQNFLEAYHPEKVGLLRMLDFVWFSDTVALPLDPNEREMTSETLLLSALGHPDYAKMIDIPMGLPDKIIADGPFMETGDDPKLWWRKWHNWDYVKDYWYQQGRRDNAYVLRRNGYPQMADEHEAKYGPGMFKQLDEVMQMLEIGIDNKSLDEKRDIVDALNFFRQELLGCSDILPRERDQLISEIDTNMMLIVKGIKLQLPDADNYEDDEIDDENDNYSAVVNGNVDTNNDIEVVSEDNAATKNVNVMFYEGEEFDLEDELGFGKR